MNRLPLTNLTHPLTHKSHSSIVTQWESSRDAKGSVNKNSPEVSEHMKNNMTRDKVFV